MFLCQEFGDQGSWRDYQTMKRHVLEDLPRRYIGVQFVNKETGRISEAKRDLDALPRKEYPIGLYGSVWESASVKVQSLVLTSFSHLFENFPQLSAIYDLHCETHPDTPRILDISVDGVSKDKHTQVPVDIFSVRFSNCSRIYTLMAVRVDNYQNYNIHEFFGHCIDEIK